jgi:K+-transporting ATPase ATPase C chain
MVLKQIRIAVTVIVLMTVLTGILYPLAITGLAQFLFPGKTHGSMIFRNGKIAGSELIGQQFSNRKYFWSRPSATSPYAYNAAASTGSNYGPLNPALLDAVKKRIADLKNMDSLNTQSIPIDLVTASSSGLDPHISIAAAEYQVRRVALVRKITEQQVRLLVTKNTEGRTLGVLGEPRVNVLLLNLALDELHHEPETK